MPANVEPSPRPSSARTDRVATTLRGLGPIGIVFILVVLVSGPAIGATLVLVWAWFTSTPWRDLGFVRPKSWLLTIAGGIVVGVAFKLLMKAVVMPLLGAPDTNPAFQYLVHNGEALPGTLLKVIVTAGVGEEIVWRGFLFERLGHLIGMTRKARIATVIITATLFGLAHYSSQHWMGVVQAFIMGLLVGAYFAATRRIWPLIVVHAAFDVIAVLIIYWGLETRVAHFVFH